MSVRDLYCYSRAYELLELGLSWKDSINTAIKEWANISNLIN